MNHPNNTANSPIPEVIQRQDGLVESLKAKLDRERTPVERFADNAARLFGNMRFAIANFLWFAIWIILNIEVIPGLKPFDAYPFSFLTMTVSLEAIFLSIFVLISENRSAAVSELREEVDVQMDIIMEYEITRLASMVNAILEKLDIECPVKDDLDFMLKPLDIEKIEDGLKRQVMQK